MPKSIKAEGLLFADVAKCMGCHSCQLACAVAHSVSKILEMAIAETPAPVARVSVEAVGDTMVPLQCRHCEDAPCVAICPTGAIEKLGPNLPVIIKEDLCIGCKFCVVVCPFGAMTLRRDGKVALKCDLCVERLAQGDRPACVTACPTGALKLTTIDDLVAEKRQAAARLLSQGEKRAVKIKTESTDGTD